MENFKAHIGKFGVLYILAALGIGAWIGSQWSTWFPKTNGVERRAGRGNRFTEFLKDNNGNPILDYNRREIIISNEKQKVPCKKVTYQGYTGWVGDCDFPIGA